MKLKWVFTYVLSLFAALSALAETPADSVKVIFLVGQSQFNPELGNNGENMANFIRKVNSACKDKDIDSITVTANASPDGSADRNHKITEERCTSIVNYIMEKTGASRSLFVTMPAGEAWNELRDLVEATPDVPQREKVLNILDNTPVWVFDDQGKITGGRKKSLMDLGGGYPFRWMALHLFPKLRNAVAVALYYKPGKSTEAMTQYEELPAQAIETAKTEVDPMPPERTDTCLTYKTTDTEGLHEATLNDASSSTSVMNIHTEGTESIQRLAIKTNLLYDAALLPNLELEFLINRNWSVALEGDAAWWKNDGKHKYYNLAVISAEVRRWFKVKQPWKGMYAGLFAGGGKYDFENGGKGYYGEGGYAGLSFGYVLPLGKYFLLDAGLGAGYMHTRYKEYRPFDGHYLYERTKTMNYFGPLKLKVSIGWRFYKTNATKKIGMAQ